MRTDRDKKAPSLGICTRVAKVIKSALEKVYFNVLTDFENIEF